MTKDRRQDTIPRGVAAGLAAALDPIAPAPGRAAAVKGAVLERVRAGRSRFVTVRAGEGDWAELAPGVHAKLLHDDGRARSFLLRMAPGTRLPAHGHAVEEVCVVLEGSAQLGDVEVHAGDFHLALEGSIHGAVASRTGALLFIRAGSGASLHF
jgi:anti-sigma factor ChrR (cupin superfamily)